MPVIFPQTSLFRKLYQYTTIGMVSDLGVKVVELSYLPKEATKDVLTHLSFVE
jgi:hypothetical protein